MGRLCGGCRSIVPDGPCGNCKKNHQTEAERRLTNPLREQYHSPKWRRKRLRILKRDKGLCQECRQNGFTAPGRQVDHIVDANEAPELFWADENLQTLCDPCHGRKTRQSSAQNTRNSEKP